MSEENLATCIQEAIGILIRRPTDPRFAQGQMGYLQHPKKLVQDARHRLLELALRQVGPHMGPLTRWLQDSLQKPETHPSWAARAIGECGPQSLIEAWYRIQCIDPEGREWGFPDAWEQVTTDLLEIEYRGPVAPHHSDHPGAPYRPWWAKALEDLQCAQTQPQLRQTMALLRPQITTAFEKEILDAEEERLRVLLPSEAI